MKKIKWTGPSQEWPAGKTVLSEGDIVTVADSVADSWVTSGHAELVREPKQPRREAAPQSADKE
jgi:hypothetical protein